MNWLRAKLLWLLWPAKGNEGFGMCANRRYRRVMMGHYEVTITYRDTSQPDGYERTELLKMLETVRKHEALQGWKVPEPNAPPTSSLMVDLRKAQKRIEVLEEALPYVVHTSGCSHVEYCACRCDCGVEEVLEKIKTIQETST